MNKSRQSSFEVGAQEAFEGVLDSMNNEMGSYKTVELMNFVTHYGFNQSPEDDFFQLQIFRKMEKSFDSDFTPDQLQRLRTNSEYLPPRAGYEDSERKVLYNFYLQHLRATNRQFELTSDQKQQQFERILSNLLEK